MRFESAFDRLPPSEPEEPASEPSGEAGRLRESTSWIYPPEAWDPLPCGGRALRRGAEAVLYIAPTPEPKPSKSKGNGRKRADEAREYSTEELLSMGGRELVGVLSRGVGRSEAARAAVRVKFLRDCVEADPALRTFGKLTLVSADPAFGTRGYYFNAKCECGTELQVNAFEWVRRSHRRSSMCKHCAIKHTRVRLVRKAAS